MQYPNYGPSTALIKRWLRSQLIDDSHRPDVVVNLLNAAVFLNTAPFDVSHLPQLGFLRFLRYVAEIDWKLQPVFVDFNQDITRKLGVTKQTWPTMFIFPFSEQRMSEIDTEFQQNRRKYPALFIVTPFDDGSSPFTRRGCAEQTLRRLSVLARATLGFVEKVEFEEKVKVLR